MSNRSEKIIFGLNRVAVSALDLPRPGIVTKSRSGSNGPTSGPQNPCFFCCFYLVEPVRGSSRDLLAPGSELAWRVASLSRSERGRAGACARALLQGVARRGAGRRGAARRAAAARDRSFCPGEAWRARRVVMTPHAEKLLVTHRGGSEPERSTCRMTG